MSKALYCDELSKHVKLSSQSVFDWSSRSFFLGQRAHEEHDEQVTRKALDMELISKLIRSFRDDEQGKSWEPGAQVVAQSR